MTGSVLPTLQFKDPSVVHFPILKMPFWLQSLGAQVGWPQTPRGGTEQPIQKELCPMSRTPPPLLTGLGPFIEVVSVYSLSSSEVTYLISQWE